MGVTLIGGLQVVCVSMTDNLVNGKPATQLWAAATARDDAVAAVKKVIPAHWTAELSTQHLTPEQAKK